MLRPDTNCLTCSTAGGTRSQKVDERGKRNPWLIVSWLVVLTPFAWLWFGLIDALREEWTSNPQYGYGWAVPILCIGLIGKRWNILKAFNAPNLVNPKSISGWRGKVAFGAFILLALLYLPTRLVEAANPEWRAVQWSLGLDTVGLTLCAISLAYGTRCLKQCFFPICLILTAIPWPTIFEAPVIQSLTRLNSGVVTELLSWLAIPSIQHGNLIEVSGGTVGIDDACSGIRSLQTSLLASLFFGEFYKMGLMRRLLLVPAGFVLAMGLNACRMLFLAIVVARNGVARIDHYHDPAGIMITLICAGGLWGLALLFRSSNSLTPGRQWPPTSENQNICISYPRFSALQRLGFFLLLWLVAVEASTELWYRGLESHLLLGPNWSVVFPTQNPTFKALPISTDAKYLLRFDEGEQGAWIEADGTRCEAFYFNWRPGRVAGYLAKRHTPEICLPATGAELLSGPKLDVMKVKEVELPMRSYVFGAGGDPIYVFQCRWEGGVQRDAYVREESSRFNLIRGIWAGRGNKGQKVLEIVITGVSNPEQAAAALARQLEQLIAVEKQ